MASSWLRKEAKGTPQKQSQTPTTLMTWRYWQIRLIKQRHYCIVWNELQQAFGLLVNAHKTEYMCYNQTGNITTLDGASLRLVDKFTYLGSSVSSTENDIDTRLTKAWTAIDRLSIIWKSDLTDERSAVSSRQRLYRYCYMDAQHGR